VLLFHNDLHPIALNSFALKQLQVQPGLPGVVLEGDRPNGWIVDPACEDVSERLFAAFSEDLILRSYRNVEALAVRGGITTIFAKDYAYVLRPLLAHQEELHTTVKPMLRCPMNRLDIGWLQKTLEEPWAKVSRPTVCIFTDGAFDGWSAAVLEPYEGQPLNYGCLFHTDEAMYQFLKIGHVAGNQVSAHAIGDAGIEQYLRTLERLLREIPRPDHRHRVEHFEMPTKDQIERLSALGGAAGMQPLLLEVCEGMDMSGYRPYIGPRVIRCNPIAETIRKGILVGGGSDFMVTDMDPLRAIACAMEHPVPEQRITVQEGLRMFTAEAARIGFLEHRKGMLRAGMDADFVVLERDPAQSSGAADVRAIRIHSTWAMGKSVFERTSGDKL
jgi:predicted amidohydrolase YtcJ